MKVAKLFIFLVFTSAAKLTAQDKIFVREYTYKASEMDSKISCRAISVNQLRSILLNEIGVYVQSERLLANSDVNGKFFQNFTENIATISAGITRLDVIDETWNGETFWMKASITVNKENLEKYLKQLIDDKQKVKELEEVKLQLNNANKTLDKLRKEQEVGSNGSDLDRSKNYNNEINTLVVGDFFLRGEKRKDVKDYHGAIAEYTRAIEINPNNSDAYRSYLGRGDCKFSLDDFQGAIVDYTKAIEILPEDHIFQDLIHLSRGLSKYNLRDYRGAIADYTKAIGSRAEALAYYRRGEAEFDLHEYKESIADLTKAIKVDNTGTFSNFAHLYFKRGLAKLNLGRNLSACLDLSKSGDLGFENPIVYD